MAMPTETEMEIFRLKVRIRLIERLLIKTAFLTSHVQGILTVAGTRTGLEGWLDPNSEVALRAYGPALQDPGLAALYADEVKDITDNLKKVVNEIGNDAEKAFGP